MHNLADLHDINIDSSPPISPLASQSVLPTHQLSDTPLANQSGEDDQDLLSDSDQLLSTELTSSPGIAFQMTPGPTSTSRKRPGEDLTQFSELVAREKKLKADEKTALLKFTKRSEAERSVIMYSEVLQLTSFMRTLTPPEVVFSIPEGLKKRIDNACFESLTEHSAAAYVTNDVPVNVVVAKLKESSFVEKITRDDKGAWDAVTSRVRAKLSDQRYLIKTAILESMFASKPKKKKGNLVEPWVPVPRESPLTILDTCVAVVNVHKAAKVKTSVELCVRVAFLRHILHKFPTIADYWELIDRELASARSKHTEPKHLSKFFVKVLEMDKKEFGEVEISNE
ncbi:hypothetical protein D9615_009667 [Tricholomella constricta]|uniref:Uncharacterized protein n=1 Tax=Tricholomella constricta TaxID=117010 RepID=A0A8H5GUB8_9AGAR|nr:hypothetical protein D9615_009667 [Tricholomella constricta]